MTRSAPMKLLVVLLFTAFLAGCGRPSVTGTYQSVGSEDKFRMTLDVREEGKATFATQSNLGNSDLDRAVKSSMAIPEGRWKIENGVMIVTGTLGDGNPAVYRFLMAPNGDLFWEKNGARLARTK